VGLNNPLGIGARTVPSAGMSSSSSTAFFTLVRQPSGAIAAGHTPLAFSSQIPNTLSGVPVNPDLGLSGILGSISSGGSSQGSAPGTSHSGKLMVIS